MTEQETPRASEPQLTVWQRATLADVAAVDFESPIAGSTAADCRSLSEHYRKVVRPGGEGDEVADSAAIRVYDMLWALTGMDFKPKEPNEPFGPMMVLADGSRSAIPSDFRGAPLEVVAHMAERATNPVLRARLSDACWLIDRKRATLATLAISSYVDVVRLVDQKMLSFEFCEPAEDQSISHDTCDLLRRALQIAYAIGWEKQEAVATRALTKELRRRASAKDALISMLWFSELDMDFGVSDPAEIAADVDRVLKNGKQNEVYVNVANDLWSAAARGYHLAKKDDDKNRCLSQAAECLVEEAERQKHSAMAASHWLSMAIRALHGIPGKKSRRTELRHRLIDVQAHIPEEMSVFSQKLDIEEIAERVQNVISKATLLDKFLVLADIARSPDPAGLRDAAVKTIAKHPLSFLFGGVHLDSEGKVVHRTEGGLGENEGAIEGQIAQAESFRRTYVVGGKIEPARLSIVERHLVSEDIFVSLLKHSPFVPPDLLVTFSRGFARFFQGDFIGATYILTPLLENSLRHVLKSHGHEVANFDDAVGTQEDKTISALFEQMRPELEAIFSKSIIADIDHVFLKKPGPSLRHAMAHGLLQDGSAYTADVVYACWLIYRLCFIPLFGRKNGIEIIGA